ncbi:tRNA (adenosine(37)-N6)-threonylcarbamoyltransferase complex ATPase subunit type 1 TsaE [Liquorilactobacillus satsumensis]|uniref:tRNA threonylcarbamoyladenosine biosynthesis protein TsaE n=1 Tax=Liquorilactobacillus satsumensis DSM 16230 = JCM 12392 TaxID=1423801 RepID=A0A0R1V2J0_9LACO|nr:tRNA (adenosine(37)-N6)-threonylcarbamoyltransferase complex ATPase subunit type 1 TsaE [Liquorilactobacillus satsumensis]KRL99726.1 ATP GTP hydrolase [Liquorilactobacillus satsumensis DSM 16230 = JCM 12392]MCC7665730.1 tRNA (adenosine(37)-N6)-threonylcarbamoyltransferase complex ATPase subunit type 1 TsaE [Liquorilactobacillus satsumensis]MCP9313462.1 tRNA (adenosine(37)-N6)-threonylcarbamoyltransferase complex ATPase subunit type 1 TsaE [Liquorilactobacillus satsumensis]MCP9328257.1 tRNA (
MEFVVESSAETAKLAQLLASFVTAGDVILLEGDLGAGKTTFTKGFAAGLGIHGNVKSPTFNLIKEYHQGRLPLYHMDVYRLEGVGGADLGLEEYFNGTGVSVVEWPQFVAEDLPAERLTIKINKSKRNTEKRLLEFIPIGAHFVAECQQLAKVAAKNGIKPS